ncbi:hypothetical protein LEN26_004142 [Aphanomyces euteiches]|nr:hypothetical protein LEN26_004142 [Aphanomyces euteiches]
MNKQGKRAVKPKTVHASGAIPSWTREAGLHDACPSGQQDSLVSKRHSTQAKPVALWCDESVEMLLRLRFHDMNERFTSVKSSQMKKDAYGILAAELSTVMQREYDHNQVQNKLHQLRKLWFHPKYKATGNGRNVRPKPQ